MSVRKTRDFLAVVFVGLTVITGKMIFIWFLVGAVVLLHPENGSGRTKLGRNKTYRKIDRDAKQFGVQLPKDRSLRRLLHQVYERYEKSSKMYPHLKSQYDEIVEDFWQSLAMDAGEDSWRYMLSTILAEWPTEKVNPQNRMRKKLEEVKKLTHQWDEAKKEALGEV